MNSRNTLDTFYDADQEVDIEIETTYTEDCKHIITFTAYKGGKRICEFNAEHMDRFYWDELETDDEG